MDYQKLANLLYPEINKDITYYTNLYNHLKKDIDH